LEELNTTELTDDQQASVRRNKFGFVFQFFHLVPRLTASENVELPMILANVDAASRKSRVQAALSSLGLSDRAKHRPDQLSGGQRQRVAIARATVMQPDVILADEPTGNLDRTSGIEVIRILENLHDRGMTLIMVTHDPDLSKRASRKVQLQDGKISTDTGGG
jgi:putative ABC transport system ATP-binding protein